MTAEEYQGALLVVAGAARNLTFVDIPDMLNRIHRADAAGPILDPTLWRKNHKKMEEDKELLEAALPLWKFGKKLEVLAKEGTG